MISIESKPKTYRARVSWYACVWEYGGRYVGKIELRDTKEETLKRAAELEKQYPHLVVSVGWFDPKANPREAISRNAEYVDFRSNPIPYLAGVV